MQHDDRDTWDNDYSKRGHVWGGAVHPLPILPATARVLELGCGNGKTLSGMLQCGWDVVATDFSLAAATLSRKAVSPDSSCDVVLSDARVSPFQSGSFDAVFVYHLLGHLTGDDRMVCTGEIERVLSRHGRIFFCEFSERDFRFGKGVEMELGTFVRGNGIRTHYFTVDEVRNLFAVCDEESVRDRSWTMRIRGKEFIRSEIQAVFVKRDP
jgi:SAM-dependent methyltransferase